MSAVQELIETLDLEPLEVNLFRGRSPQSRWQRVFGGQVIGQALVAACRTVDDVTARPPHSLHAYFMLGGDPRFRSSTRSTASATARVSPPAASSRIQHGHAIFTMAVSFHLTSTGCRTPPKMPDVPAPEKLPTEAELKERIWPMMPEPVRRYYERERPIELRPVEMGRYLGEKNPEGRFNVWIRATGRIARFARDPSMRAGLRVRHDAARRRAHSARQERVQRRHHGGEPRPCAVVSPPVPCRRVAALRAGLTEP